MMEKSFKKVLVLCMVFAMMFLTGCESLSMQTVADGTYDNNGLPVYVETGNLCSQVQYNFVINTLSEAPEYLRRNCKGVYILSYTKYNEARGGTTSAGFARPGTLEIFLNLSSISSDSEWSKKTIIHELSHVYDFTHGTATLDTSYTPEFLALYEAEKYNVNFSGENEYYQNSNQEFFAECFSYYVLEPERLPASLIQYFDSLPK